MCFQFCKLRRSILCVAQRDVVGQTCTGNPETSATGWLSVPFDRALGQKPQQRPEVIRETSGSCRECHFNVPESHRAPAQIGQLYCYAQSSTVRAFRNGHVFWTPDHVQPHTKTEHILFLLAVSFEANVELCWYCCCSQF